MGRTEKNQIVRAEQRHKLDYQRHRFWVLENIGNQFIGYYWTNGFLISSQISFWKLALGTLEEA